MSDHSWEALTPARQRAGLTMAALYFRYIALGGAASHAVITAHLATGAILPAVEHDVVVHVINERFLELGADERLPYRLI